jgi:hypothetical protein
MNGLPEVARCQWFVRNAKAPIGIKKGNITQNNAI